MALEKYHEKRDFSATTEPRGRAHRSDPGHLSYVVQEHAARRLHHDFRLELGGVLLSWAVPKGASVDPAHRRLAVRTEDHPLEYGTFEGTIPAGEYGAGTVMLWDRGTWAPEGDPVAGLRDGHLTFTLHGERLRGGWHLVRTGRGEQDWLLIKRRDEHADDGEGPVARFRTSIASGRSMDDIARSADRSWTREGSTPTAEELRALPGARSARFTRLRPALPGARARPPDGPGWLHELELDGLRILVSLRRGVATLRGPRGRDLTAQLAPLARAFEALPVGDALFDGLLVAEGPDGRTSLARLRQLLAQDRPEELSARMFDLPSACGVDLRRVPLVRRKEVLARLLRADRSGLVRPVDHVEDDGPRVLAAACRLGVPGIVSKLADAPYPSARSEDWRRTPCPSATPRERPARSRSRVSHPDKVLYPELGLTKGELADWVQRMAPVLLPHVAHRPLSLVRCPNGHTRPCFFQRHRGSAPDVIRPVVLPEDDRAYLTIADLEGLAALVQLGTLELHPWGARTDRLDRPDRLVFDLDPHEGLPFPAVIAAAREVRDRLAAVSLRSFVRWSGGKGLHVVVPLGRRAGWDETKEFARRLAVAMAAADPGAYVATATKSRRAGKVFVDWLRNGRGATAIATWSMRARPGAPVAVPLRWEELTDDLDLTSARVPLVEVPRRDPWEGFFALRQRLPRDRPEESQRRLVKRPSGVIRADHARPKEDTVPKAWSDKDERQYEHVLESEREKGRNERRAEEIAARTVNKGRRAEGRTQEQRGEPRRRRRRSDGATREELYAEAKRLRVRGRSNMNKSQLEAAVRRAR